MSCLLWMPLIGLLPIAQHEFNALIDVLFAMDALGCQWIGLLPNGQHEFTALPDVLFAMDAFDWSLTYWPA
jgi:hypothetical protein